MNSLISKISVPLSLCVKKQLDEFLQFIQVFCQSRFYIFPIRNRKFAFSIKFFSCSKFITMPFRWHLICCVVKGLFLHREYYIKKHVRFFGGV